LFYTFFKAYKLFKNQNHCIVQLERIYVIKVNERQLFVYEYLYLEKLLSTATEVIGNADEY
jgi:hypothetical protein